MTGKEKQESRDPLKCHVAATASSPSLFPIKLYDDDDTADSTRSFLLSDNAFDIESSPARFCFLRTVACCTGPLGVLLRLPCGGKSDTDWLLLCSFNASACPLADIGMDR